MTPSDRLGPKIEG